MSTCHCLSYSDKIQSLLAFLLMPHAPLEIGECYRRKTLPRRLESSPLEVKIIIGFSLLKQEATAGL